MKTEKRWIGPKKKRKCEWKRGMGCPFNAPNPPLTDKELVSQMQQREAASLPDGISSLGRPITRRGLNNARFTWRRINYPEASGLATERPRRAGKTYESGTSVSADTEKSNAALFIDCIVLRSKISSLWPGEDLDPNTG